MFKTIHECGLELVEHSVYATEPQEFTLLGDSSAYGAKNWHLASTQHCDDLPVRAARASFGKQDKTGKNPAADKKLMTYLAEHKHLTPFEYQHATFLIECPLFIRSQIHRHRTFSYNEISRRYTDENLAFWVPDTFRGQSSDNKQASSDEVIDSIVIVNDVESFRVEPENAWYLQTDAAMATYTAMVKAGVAREIARAILPQSLLTQFYMGGTLRNWQHFIELRRDPHAQYEVQVIANRIAEQLRALWPDSCEALGI